MMRISSTSSNMDGMLTFWDDCKRVEEEKRSSHVVVTYGHVECHLYI